MSWSVAFHAWGEHFMPGRVAYTFTEAHDRGAIGIIGHDRGQPRPYGSATIEVPEDIPRGACIKYLVEQALPLLPSLVEAGATEWHVSIGRFYTAQCNEELTAQELALLVKLDCPLCYSAYDVREEE